MKVKEILKGKIVVGHQLSSDFIALRLNENICRGLRDTALSIDYCPGIVPPLLSCCY